MKYWGHSKGLSSQKDGDSTGADDDLRFRQSPEGPSLILSRPSFFGTKASDGSIRFHHAPNTGERERGVHFRGRVSIRTIHSLTEEGNYENPRYLQLSDLEDDPNYLPGFVTLYNSKELVISEDTCCCSGNIKYRISEDDVLLYNVEKKTEGCVIPFLKCCWFGKSDLMRVGYSIKLFNTSSHGTKLLTYRRSSHCWADQLDIVEVFYSIEESYIGRIEVTREGYRIINRDGMEEFRVLRESRKEETSRTIGGSLLVISTDSLRPVAKIGHSKLKCFWKCGLVKPVLKHRITWSDEISVAMKPVVLGVLFLELHRKENFVDLPLGRDAVSSAGGDMRTRTLHHGESF